MDRATSSSAGFQSSSSSFANHSYFSNLRDNNNGSSSITCLFPDHFLTFLHLHGYILFLILSITIVLFNTIILAIFVGQRGRYPLSKVHIHLIALDISDITIGLYEFLRMDLPNMTRGYCVIFTCSWFFIVNCNRFLMIYISHQRIMAVWSLRTAVQSRTKTQKRVIAELVILFVLTAFYVMGGFLMTFLGWSLPGLLGNIFQFCLFFMLTVILFLKSRSSRLAHAVVQNNSQMRSRSSTFDEFQKLVGMVGVVYCVTYATSVLHWSLVSLDGHTYGDPSGFAATILILINSTANLPIYCIVLRQFRETISRAMKLMITVFKRMRNIGADSHNSPSNSPSEIPNVIFVARPRFAVSEFSANRN